MISEMRAPSRLSYGRIPNLVELKDLIATQLESFHWFKSEGLLCPGDNQFRNGELYSNKLGPGIGHGNCYIGSICDGYLQPFWIFDGYRSCRNKFRRDRTSRYLSGRCFPHHPASTRGGICVNGSSQQQFSERYDPESGYNPTRFRPRDGNSLAECLRGSGRNNSDATNWVQ